MADLIQIKRGTATTWTTLNPILAQGEPALEIDTKKEKIGDGVTAWNDLPYRTTGGGFPIITIAGRPWELRKTVNQTDQSKTSTLEAGDVILGSRAAGQFEALKYNGGDATDFDANYELITGI